ncbi:MAG TPA: FAD-binding protein [Gemmatimonadaceae bacterium]|nr:FAD-binding protein [Gemmatimonadaceae bacterium]
MTTPEAVTLPEVPRLVATRGADVQDAVRDAHARREPLRIAGAGTWLHAGRPVAADTTLDLSRLSGIVEYVPGDLTLTARAGTSLAEIDDTVRANGQWLPLDAFGTTAGTLGATLATASAGPLAASIGLPRDVALGIAFVTGDGRLVRGGGRVVKNVAGFDLVRLAVGAWGTLGIIVEATVRLRARPETDRTLAMALPADRTALTTCLRRVREAEAAPVAAELVGASLAPRLGLDEGADWLLVRLAGNSEAVGAQEEALARGRHVHEVAPDVWQRLRATDPAEGLVVRLSQRPGELARLWTAAQRLEAAGGARHATLERGVVRAWVPMPDEDVIAAFLAELGAADARIFERLPPAWWPRLAPAPADPLARALRRAFDPAAVLNRGILGASEEQAG